MFDSAVTGANHVVRTVLSSATARLPFVLALAGAGIGLAWGSDTSVLAWVLAGYFLAKAVQSVVWTFGAGDHS